MFCQVTHFNDREIAQTGWCVCAPPADIGSCVFSNILVIILEAGGSGVPGAGGFANKLIR